MTSKRFLAVVNPRGGTRRGLAVLEQVRPVFLADRLRTGRACPSCEGLRLDAAIVYDDNPVVAVQPVKMGRCPTAGKGTGALVAPTNEPVAGRGAVTQRPTRTSRC
jgi:hypothetical protein